MKSIVLSFLIVCLSVSCSINEKEVEKKTTYSQENYIEKYSNGLKKLEGKLVNGERHGVWVYYYESGIKWSEGKYINGVRDGYSIVYYESGKKKLQGDYIDGKRAGVWKVWNEDGSFNDEINFDEILSKKDSLNLEKIP